MYIQVQTVTEKYQAPGVVKLGHYQKQCLLKYSI